MGYRDDFDALKFQHQLLERDVASLEETFNALRAEGETLQRNIAKKKVKLFFFRIGRWMARHPKTMVILVGMASLAGYIAYQAYEERALRQQMIDKVLGTGCSTTLQINASYDGANVRINGAWLGKAPQKVKICPNIYDIQLNHNLTIPWQRRVRIKKQKRIVLNANLIPRSSIGRTGMVIHSVPSNALLFIDDGLPRSAKTGACPHPSRTGRVCKLQTDGNGHF